MELVDDSVSVVPLPQVMRKNYEKKKRRKINSTYLKKLPSFTPSDFPALKAFQTESFLSHPWEYRGN